MKSGISSQGPGVSESAFVRHLVQTLLSLSTHGACVIVGRGAPHVLPPVTTLRVAVVAPREDRVANLALQQGVSRHEAARRVETIDRDRLGFVKDHFGKNAADPTNYDLVLNSMRFSRAECADLVLEALHRREAHAVQASPA